MHSIRSKIAFMTVCAIVVSMLVSTVFGLIAMRSIGNNSAKKSLNLLCEVGQKNLDSYFTSVEQSVEMVAAYVESDLTGLDDEQLQAHLDRAGEFFKRVTYYTGGILTYYYRIDPEVSTTNEGFWYVNLDGEGFVKHEVTDITKYDTEDTSQLVWFTVAKATGESLWLSPYITDNLGARVISYNVPVYLEDRFVGVIGIELDYSVMADQVDNITLYDNGYAFILDAEGNIVYHPHMDLLTLEEEGDPEVPAGLLSDKNYVRYTYNGVKKEAVWLPLSNGMRLYVSVPLAEINASWMRWAIGTTAVFLVMLAIFVVLILRFTGRITQPLTELTDAAERVGHGDYDVELAYDGKDEVGILTRTFNQLISYLKGYIRNLSDMAYVDALTSVRNKGAYDAYVAQLQAQVSDSTEALEFAVCIFDCNSLKEINDQYGHEKGDVYLKAACALICEVFDHSPVFRIGGDEFAAILQNDDYVQREQLVRTFDEMCEKSRQDAKNRWDQVDVARGMTVYDASEDYSVDDTLRRADKLMYENKRESKAARSQ